MKHLLIFSTVFLLLVTACKKAQIEHTKDPSQLIPWTDTSSLHPKNVQLNALLEKYRLKGLPGISLLVNDQNGTWVGSTGKADIVKNISFGVGQVSKGASITKLFIGTLVFKLMEDSLNSGLGYNSLYKPVSAWLPENIISKLPNGRTITLGQCMKHETGIPDLINESKFYPAILKNQKKK